MKYVSGFTLDINPVMFSFPCRFFYVTKEISYLKRNAGNPRVKGQGFQNLSNKTRKIELLIMIELQVNNLDFRPA